MNDVIKTINEYNELLGLEIDPNQENREEIKKKMRERIAKGKRVIEEITKIIKEDELFEKNLDKMDLLEKFTERKLKEVLYDKEKIEYEEIVNKIINKSHLVFIIEFDHFGENKENTVYIEEKIQCYDSYITHSNTKSFIINEYNIKHPSKGLLIGGRMNQAFLSFEYIAKENKVTINKDGKMNGGRMVKNIKIIEMEKTESEKEKEEKYKERDTENTLSRYCIMIISKYFNSVYDYINMEKTYKEYNGIVEQFKYNPVPFNTIKEREIFFNIETYHFYDYNIPADVISQDKRIKKTMNWCSKYGNEHVFNNMDKLEEWSKCEFKEVLYNSDVDGQSNRIFRDKIVNHSKLYFIVVDENDNVFGHYQPSQVIERVMNSDRNIFLFSLYSNGRSGIEKMLCKYNKVANNTVATIIYSDYYACANNQVAYRINSNKVNSYFSINVSKLFMVNDVKLFTGKEPDRFGCITFKWKTLMVIEMK